MMRGRTTSYQEYCGRTAALDTLPTTLASPVLRTVSEPDQKNQKKQENWRKPEDLEDPENQEKTRQKPTKNRKNKRSSEHRYT